jgi:hypothetical protein
MVLQSQNNVKYNVMAKEVAATIAAVDYQRRLDGKAWNSITPTDYSDKLNIVSNSTSTTEGTHDGSYFWNCSLAQASQQACLVLHDGGVLQILPFGQIGISYQVFVFDPDNSGPFTRVVFYLEQGGRLTSGSTKGFIVGSGAWDTDPDWFSW